tara:strand:+ start:264 stop:1319 length:1056 start_codon:yes stop_codon:yes gene_type:complete
MNPNDIIKEEYKDLFYSITNNTVDEFLSYLGTTEFQFSALDERNRPIKYVKDKEVNQRGLFIYQSILTRSILERRVRYNTFNYENMCKEFARKYKITDQMMLSPAANKNASNYFLKNGYLEIEEYLGLKEKEILDNEIDDYLNNIEIDGSKTIQSLDCVPFQKYNMVMFEYLSSISGIGREICKSTAELQVYRHHDGDEQYDYHVDSYSPIIKWFYFLGLNEPDDKGFSYVRGSTVPTYNRLKFLYDTSCGIADGKTNRNGMAGSFRALRHGEEVSLGHSAECLESIGYSKNDIKFFNKNNSLVCADTSGFHARSRATTDSERIIVHGEITLGSSGDVGRSFAYYFYENQV